MKAIDGVWQSLSVKEVWNLICNGATENKGL